MAWSSGRSARSQTLPKDWHRRRAIARREAGGICQWQTDSIRCTELGTDCDHIIAGGPDEPSNLQWLCKTHHRAKSSAEGHAAQRAVRARAKRPVERHPGLR